MPVLHYSNSPYKAVRPGLERRLIYAKDLMMVIADFTDGPWLEKEPPHSHPHEQTTYIAEGEVVFYCEDEPEQHLKPGDMFVVPSGKLHTIKLLTKTARLVDSFTPLRKDFLM